MVGRDIRIPYYLSGNLEEACQCPYSIQIHKFSSKLAFADWSFLVTLGIRQQFAPSWVHGHPTLTRRLLQVKQPDRVLLCLTTSPPELVAVDFLRPLYFELSEIAGSLMPWGSPAT